MTFDMKTPSDGNSELLADRAAELVTDTLVHGTAADKTVRCMAAITTLTVAEAARRHQTAPTATAALGRLLTGALLLGASLKDFDRLTAQIACDGKIQGLYAEANNKGDVRGYVKNPQADALPNRQGKFDVRGILGQGMFYITRESGFDIGFTPEPYRGSVPLTSGEIAEDFAYYLAKSEQIPSAVMLGVLLQGTEQRVLAAGGVMIQMMPDADDTTVAAIEAAVQNAPHITASIRAGAAPADLIRAALGGFEFELLEEKPVRFSCNCSFERALSLVSALDEAELRDMLEKDKGAVLTCHFCNENYRLDENDLAALIAEK
jgi:molecular chaperone Hsp33